MVPRAEQGGRGDVGVVRLVVVAGGDEDVIARLCGIHGRLNRRVLPGMAVVGANEQHGGRAAARRARRQRRSGQEGGAQRAQPARHDGPTCHGGSNPGRWSSGGQRSFDPRGRTYSRPVCHADDRRGSIDRRDPATASEACAAPVRARGPPPAPRPTDAGSRPPAAPGTRAGPAANPWRSSAAPARLRSRCGRCWPRS